MTLGNTILKYRKELGITQDALAQKLEVTNQAVSKWESDQCCPDINLLPRLADIFDITIDELFGREAPAKPELVISDVPWGDDGNLRGVVYLGRKLVGHERSFGEKVKLFFKGKVDKNVYCDFSLECGDVGGCVEVEGNVACGNVGGNVETDGNVECGDVGGNVETDGNVTCQNVDGHVDSGGSVTCWNVGSHVDAGSNVTCGNVEGDVDAGGNVICGNVDGSVDAGGNVTSSSVGGSIDAGGGVTIEK